jgi:polyisoprenoid-binding protein YceI
MIRQRVIAVALAALGLCSGPALAAKSWSVDPAASQLVFVPKVAGGEFEGRFRRFDASIRFDPADLEHSSFEVDVDLAGADTGDAERDETLKGNEFFAVARWPHARFTTQRIRALGGGKFEAEGTLSVRDVTRKVAFPFEFKAAAGPGGNARMRGATTLKRLEYGVGQGEWKDTEWVADDVRLRFDLVLKPAP